MTRLTWVLWSMANVLHFLSGAAIVKPQYSATYSTQTTPQRQVVPPKPAVSAVQYSQYAPPQQQQQTPAQAVSSYTASYSTPASIQPTSQLNKVKLIVALINDVHGFSSFHHFEMSSWKLLIDLI